jgi:signal transduction histidine kinase
MNKIDNILKQFSITDGLLRGTAIIANLVTIGAISVISGFGANALLNASSIQMLVTAFLELPAGILADRIGAEKVLKLSLKLKTIVTMLFMLAVYYAFKGNTELAWICFTLEVIVDAFANSFMSGSYQSTYLQWYKHKCDSINEMEPPKLFIASLAFGIKIRFLIPFSVLITTITVYYFGKINFKITELDSVFISLIFVFILRITLWAKVYFDIRNIAFEYQKKRRTLSEFLRPFKSILSGDKIIFVYAVAFSINMLSLLYFSGLSFKYFNALDLSKTWTWILGIAFGSFLFYLRTAVSVFLFPKLKKIDEALLLNSVFLIMTLVGLMGALFFTYDNSNTINLIIIICFNLVIACCTELALRFIESNLDNYTDKANRATWISTANTIGYIFFGIVSVLIIKYNLHSIATIMLSLLIGLISAYAIVVRKTGSLANTNLSLSNLMSANFKKVFSTIALLLFTCDLLIFSLTSIHLQKLDEKRVGTLIHDALYEPLSQGSFVEARRRLDKLTSSKTIECANLLIWDFQESNCKLDTNNILMLSQQNIKLYVGSNKTSPAGEINIYFDRSNIIRSIIFRLLFSIMFFFALWFAVVYMFRKLSGTIEVEINRLTGFVQQNEPKTDLLKKISIYEFQQLAKKLESTFELELKISEQNMFNKIAKQMAHDIRSPITALLSASSFIKNKPEESAKLIKMAAERVDRIANDLLKNSNQYSTDFTSGGLIQNQFSVARKGKNESNISDLIREIVSEKRIEYMTQENIVINELIYENKRAILCAQNFDLKRLLSNLINNSAEASHGKNIININARINDLHTNITITDEGAGISPDILEGLKSDYDTAPITTKESGHGLGLRSAKTELKKIGGKLNINSKLNVGTVVEILIPTRIVADG